MKKNKKELNAMELTISKQEIICGVKLAVIDGHKDNIIQGFKDNIFTILKSNLNIIGFDYNPNFLLKHIAINFFHNNKGYSIDLEIDLDQQIIYSFEMGIQMKNLSNFQMKSLLDWLIQ